MRKALVLLCVLSLIFIFLVEGWAASSKSKFYIIGIGSGDPDLITMRAIHYIAKADVFVCGEDIKKRFAGYIGNRPVLFDPVKISHLFHSGEHDEFKKNRKKHAQMIKDALNAGKIVAYLDWGDPSVYGSWRHFINIEDYFDDETIEIIPGISSFNAGNALVERDIGCKGSIIITAPWGLKANNSLIESAAKNGDTLVIFMGLRDIENLMPLLQKGYQSTTPVTLVYDAGFTGRERLIKTTLVELQQVAEKEKEKFLGLIYIGPCLK